MQRVVDGVYTVRGLTAGRVYVIDTGQGLALVDTSIKTNTADILEPQLKAHRWTLQDIRTILITHAHTDHVNALPDLQRKTPARTVAHRREALVIRGERPIQYADPTKLTGFTRLIASTMKMPTHVPVAKVDVEINGDTALDEVIPGLCALETFGHTIGHTSYWWAERRILFGGDAMLNLPWGLRRPFAIVNTDADAVHDSIRKIAKLGVETLCPGHGQPIISGAQAKIGGMMQRIGL